MADFSTFATPGRFLIELFPWFRHAPAWLPGSGFKHIAANFNKTKTAVTEVPFAFVQSQIASGTAVSSFVHDLLVNEELSEEQKENIKLTAGSIYSGMYSEILLVILAQY
jgi:hypothetical protein